VRAEALAAAPSAAARGEALPDPERCLVLDDVSKFYGEVLGVNRVSLSIPPGITSLVGPNGSGKTTLMNVVTGLLRPTRGTIRVLGVSPDDPERMFRRVGYCTQYDAFPRGMTGRQFLTSFLRLHGMPDEAAQSAAAAAIERVGMGAAADRKVAAYSKGMRQRIKLAHAIAHEPAVLVLDEPLNGLDPMARAEVLQLLEGLAGQGLHVVLSSHVLHEVDRISDRVILMSGGYVVAEGNIQGVRSEMQAHPMQILLRCEQPALLASRLFEAEHVVEVKIHDDRRGLLVHTRDADRFYLMLNRIVVEDGLALESVAPADDDVRSVYKYLVGGDRAAGGAA
jgi:ABC-2 type transport system ATP-binding protein